MKLSQQAAAVWLLLGVLAPAPAASRVKQEASFHPKHHNGRRSSKAHHGVKHTGKAGKSTTKATAPSTTQAPHVLAQAAELPPAPTEKAPAAAQQPPPPPITQAAPSQTALPAVAVSLAAPPPAPYANEGLPQLPAVSSMLGSAAETLKQINSQANILEARVVQTQMENEARMARQKAVFEQKLKDQEQENKAIDAVNNGISQEIGNLKKTNLETEKHAKEVQAMNHLMRVELATLKTKLAVSREFLAASLLSTDDSKATELDVLQDAKAKKQRTENQVAAAAQVHESRDTDAQEDDDALADDDDAEDADGDDGEPKGTSFLAVRSSTMAVSNSFRSDNSEEASDALAEVPDQPESDPRDLLKVLSTGVDSLEQQEKESEAKLKAMFLSNFREGTKRRKGSLQQQKQLNATRATLLDYQAKLRTADGHLQGTRGKLEQQLHGLGAFLQKLAAVAMGPAASAEQQMKDLPNGVIIPDGPADGADAAAGSVLEGVPAAAEEAAPPH